MFRWLLKCSIARIFAACHLEHSNECVCLLCRFLSIKRTLWPFFLHFLSPSCIVCFAFGAPKATVTVRTFATKCQHTIDSWKISISYYCRCRCRDIFLFHSTRLTYRMRWEIGKNEIEARFIRTLTRSLARSFIRSFVLLLVPMMHSDSLNPSIDSGNSSFGLVLVLLLLLT